MSIYINNGHRINQQLIELVDNLGTIKSPNGIEYELVVSDLGKYSIVPKTNKKYNKFKRVLHNYLEDYGYFHKDLDESGDGIGYRWTPSNMTGVINNNVQTLTATVAGAQIRADISQPVNTNLWYIGGWVKTQETSVNISAAVKHTNETLTDYSPKVVQSATGGQWVWISFLIDLSTYNTGHVVAIYVKDSYANGYTLDVKNLVFYNLTEAFMGTTIPDKTTMDALCKTFNNNHVTVALDDEVVVGDTEIDLLLKDYTLTFSDDFTANSLDTTKWSHRYLGVRRSATNVQEAIEVSNGSLKIKTYKEGSTIKTGMISTEGKFSQKYGYFECRCKLNKTNGCWSAFWVQTPTMGAVIGNTRISGTEIDVMEYFDAHSNRTQHTLHYDGYGANHKQLAMYNYTPEIVDLKNTWHTYGVLWDTNGYKFYIDGYKTYETTTAPSDVLQYIILSCECDTAQAYVINNFPFTEDVFEIDYVKVWQKN